MPGTSSTKIFTYATFLAHPARCNFINGTVWDKLFNSLIIIGFCTLSVEEIKTHVTPYIEEAGGVVLGAVKAAPFHGTEGVWVIVRKER